ncbi:MAG: PrsW family glutamic-type intramembrane protease [Sphingomicrobium sp.]
MTLIEVINWSFALVPVLVLAGSFYWLDVFKLMSRGEAAGLLLLGACSAAVAYPISGVFLDTLPLGFNFYSRVVAPWIEEGLKAVAVIGLFRFNKIGLKVDALIAGFTIGAGFSVVENIIYLLRFPDLMPSVWMVRGAGTAIMHGSTAAILAALAHQFAERRTRAAAGDFHFNILWFVPGLLIAVAIHTLFNQFPDRPMVAMLGTLLTAPLVLIAIFRYGTKEAREWLVEEEDAHKALLAALDAGAFPDTAGWRRIADLVARSGEQMGSLIREYVLVLTRLVLESEETMLKQSGDTHLLLTDSGRLFLRLTELKRELGPATVHGLTSLLPFSRNDYWEVWELHRHLR